MDHLMAHLNGERTYGHYLLDTDDTAKLFVFDIDLEETGSWVKLPDWNKLPVDEKLDQEAWAHEQMVVTEDVNPRALWADRSRTAAPARSWFKYQMKMLGSILAAGVRHIGVECAVSYSGSKGIHVYGFTGRLPADEVREAALLVLEH